LQVIASANTKPITYVLIPVCNSAVLLTWVETVHYAQVELGIVLPQVWLQLMTKCPKPFMQVQSQRRSITERIEVL
jgi:hypothetical protein